MNHEAYKSINKVLKRSSPTCIYSIAILDKGYVEVGIVSAIGTFSTYGIDDVSLVNSTTLTSHSCFRNLSCVTCGCKLPAAPTNQTSTEKAAGKEWLERVFAGAALSIVKPTAICALLKFKELCSTCSTKFGLAHPKLSIKASVKRCKDGPIFKLEYDTSINFGILFEILG